jgi:hypothetical protein
VKSWVVLEPTDTVATVGLTVMAVTPLRKTVAVAVAVSPWASAVMVAVPNETPVSTPLAALIVAIVLSLLDQLIPLVTRERVPSV